MSSPVHPYTTRDVDQVPTGIVAVAITRWARRLLTASSRSIVFVQELRRLRLFRQSRSLDFLLLNLPRGEHSFVLWRKGGFRVTLCEGETGMKQLPPHVDRE